MTIMNRLIEGKGVMKDIMNRLIEEKGELEVNSNL